MFYLTMHSTHFIYGYMASDIWLRTILIVRKETHCCHIGYSYRLTARVLLYAPSHRQDNTYHGLCYTSRGTRNSSMGPPHEGSIRRPIAPWANALPLSYVPLLTLSWDMFVKEYTNRIRNLIKTPNPNRNSAYPNHYYNTVDVFTIVNQTSELVMGLNCLLPTLPTWQHLMVITLKSAVITLISANLSMHTLLQSSSRNDITVISRSLMIGGGGGLIARYSW